MQSALKPLHHSEDLIQQTAKWYTCHWYALYVRSRHEKFVCDALTKKSIETYLPLREITRNWSDRKKIIHEPLFSSYVFVNLAIKDRWDILNTKGVVRFVGPSAARPVEVCEEDLAAIKKFLHEKVQLDPFPYLKEGQRVYVKSGPFKGTEGFIVRKDEHCRLVLSLDVLMQSVSIQIDQSCIEML